MRKQLILMTLLLCTAFSASARVSVDIGIHVPIFPRLVQVPSYPVYYAPDLDSNYFFYDGAYWVYQDDDWYSSSWYDGPWDLVEPEFVPSFILRVPVGYYRLPPRYFLGWHRNAPPRWHDHWGHHWAERRRGWDHWDRRAVHAPAPLPVYQRNYSGDRYPRLRDQQRDARNRHYNYGSRESSGRTRDRESNPRWDRQHNDTSRQPMPSQQRESQQTTRREQTRDRNQWQQRNDAPRQLMAAQRDRNEERRFSQRDRQPDQEWNRRSAPSRESMSRGQDSQRAEQRERRVQPSQQTAAPERWQQRRSQPSEQRLEQRSQPREQRQDHAQRSSQDNNRGRSERGRGHDRDRGGERR